MAGSIPTYEKGKLYLLELSRITPDPEQPRKFFDEQALGELAASITSHGVLQLSRTMVNFHFRQGVTKVICHPLGQLNLPV